MLRCCGFYFTRLNGCFIQETNFSCSQIKANFDGTRMNASILDGATINTFGWDEGTFNGASFNDNSTKGLLCSGDGIMAKGARFNCGVTVTDFHTNMKAIVGQEGEFKGENKVETFPDEKLEELEDILDINSPDKFYCHTVHSIKHGQHGNTGWVINDLGEFTINDSEKILKYYKDALNKLK